MNEEMLVDNILDINQTIAKEIFDGVRYPWEVISEISEFIINLGKTLSPDEYELKGENIWISRCARVAPTAYIDAPVIICANAEIRHCAFIRGSAIIGESSVIGNSTELKNCIIFNNAQIPHYNYVGDSILGYKSHLGAGTKTSNLKSDRSEVTILKDDERIKTGLIKFGSVVGDNVEVGCNAVLNPGTVIGRNTMVYPLSMVRGFIPQNSIYKHHIGEVYHKTNVESGFCD